MNDPHIQAVAQRLDDHLVECRDGNRRVEAWLEKIEARVLSYVKGAYNTNETHNGIRVTSTSGNLDGVFALFSVNWS